jgi:hypothetical protein
MARVTSMKTFYLTEEEMKTIVVEHLKHTVLRRDTKTLSHLYDNWETINMEWVDGEFAISVDGEMEA